jgi:molecular chaperone DnaK (HSP70)
MQRLAHLITTVLEDARIPQESVNFVVRTGGSSQIVAVKNLLESRFPGKVTEHDAFTSVAKGLAIASYHRLSAAAHSFVK